MKRILCYGDSNTWGFTPVTGKRYAPEVRWTGAAQAFLGESYQILEDGISGRTTVWEDPFVPYRNGLEGIGYGLLRSKPIDLVVLMLGTNDLYHTNARGYYRGLSRLTRTILDAPVQLLDSSPVFTEKPKVLLVSPITLHPDIAAIRPELGLRYEESAQFARYTQCVAQEYDLPWMDAGQVARASDADGLHMEPESHAALGRAIGEKIREIL